MVFSLMILLITIERKLPKNVQLFNYIREID